VSRYELLTLPLPFILWYVTFRSPFFGFWATLGTSSAVLLLVCAPRLTRMGFRLTVWSLAVGVVSAVALYLFFWSGYQVAKNIPGFVQTLSSVYGLRGATSTQEISALLLFPIGPAEELYWRGLIQRSLSERLSQARGLLATSTLYTLIHLPTLNPSLLLVALVGGLVWGTIYNRYRSVLPVVLSHVIFDEMIFVFFVIS